MTHSPLPYKANGNQLLDARGNVIAVFRDHRDAQAFEEAISKLENDVDQLQKELQDAESECDSLQVALETARGN